MTRMTRTVLAALLFSVPAAPLVAQSSASLFPKSSKSSEGTGSSAASLFPQADLDAAADISVGIEAPAPKASETIPPASSDATLAAPTPLAPTPGPAPQIEPLRTAAAGSAIRPRVRPDALELQADQVAANCIDPGAVRDRDVARNLGAFEVNPNLCITEERFAEHGRRWHMVIIQNRKARRGPVWAILHDNEDSAFDSALYAVSRYGGKMVALETGEGRSFSGQDPNRNFGASSKITAPCRNMTARPAPAFTDAINRHFDRRYPVLTMHSNDNGYAGAGGAGHISAKRTSATMKGIMSPHPQGSLSDEDNAVLTAGTVPFEQNKKAQKLASYLGGQGINMIYEHVRTNTNDCSFSFHVKLNNLGDYYNIEVEHGRIEDQKQILDALLAYLGINPRRG